MSIELLTESALKDMIMEVMEVMPGILMDTMEIICIATGVGVALAMATLI